MQSSPSTHPLAMTTPVWKMHPRPTRAPADTATPAARSTSGPRAAPSSTVALGWRTPVPRGRGRRRFAARAKSSLGFSDRIAVQPRPTDRSGAITQPAGGVGAAEVFPSRKIKHESSASPQLETRVRTRVPSPWYESCRRWASSATESIGQQKTQADKACVRSRYQL